MILDNGAASEQSACAGLPATPDSGPFYCRSAVSSRATKRRPARYLHRRPLAEPTDVRRRPARPFAIASVVAHEFGHHVQAQLRRAGASRPTALPGKFRELSADCLGEIGRHRRVPPGRAGRRRRRRGDDRGLGRGSAARPAVPTRTARARSASAGSRSATAPADRPSACRSLRHERLRALPAREPAGRESCARCGYYLRWELTGEQPAALAGAGVQTLSLHAPRTGPPSP